MNNYQELWWQQAKSDHEVFLFLRREGFAQCHSLHYLQMVTEKIAKAYFWREGKPPSKSHAGLAQFLRFLGQIRQKKDRERIADLFAYTRFDSFQNSLKAVLPIAYDLQRLAPALANDGPNPEYPWPHQRPESAPVNHNFATWASLESAQGRQLMKIIRIALNRFPEYADA